MDLGSIANAITGAGSGTEASPIFGAAGGILAGAGIFGLILGILAVLAGAGSLAGHSWGRWIGVILSVLGVLVGVLFVLGGLGAMSDPNAGGPTTLIIGIVWVALYGLTAYALISASAYFSYRR